MSTPDRRYDAGSRLVRTGTCAASLTIFAFGIGLVVAGDARAEKPRGSEIRDKTLVVWVAPANLSQQGGSALTLENPPGEFDAIVFGELAPARWMAGSDLHRRTERDQADYPAETSDGTKLVQIAVAYRGRNVAIFRDGQPYASYEMGVAPAVFSTESVVLLGLRHLGGESSRFFHGAIDDARIYRGALDAKALRALKRNRLGGPKPLAWWDFEDGRPVDRIGSFPAGKLVGAATITGGWLRLAGGCLVIGEKAGRAGAIAAAFVDDFDAGLDPDWRWLREDPAAWRLRDGALEIRLQPGHAGTVKNALLRDAPDRREGKYAIDVTLTSLSVPTQQYEQAGITWYSGGKPVFKFVKERVGGQLMTIPGRKPMDRPTVELRIIVTADSFVAQYKPDGTGEFLTAATGRLPPPGRDEVSLQGYHGPADAAHWIRFDDFRITRLKE